MVLECNVATEISGLMSVHLLTIKSDKVKLCAQVQIVIKLGNKLVAQYRNAEAAECDIIDVLPVVLASRFRSALKLK